jgi:hypothetical protein
VAPRETLTKQRNSPFAPAASQLPLRDYPNANYDNSWNSFGKRTVGALPYIDSVTGLESATGRLPQEPSPPPDKTFSSLV